MECREMLQITSGVLGRVFTQADLAQRPFMDITIGPEEIVAIFRRGIMTGTVSSSSLGPGGRILDRVKRVLGRSADSEMMYIDTSEKMLFFALGSGREAQPRDRYGNVISGIVSLTVEVSHHGIPKLYPLVKRKSDSTLALGDVRRRIRNDVIFRAITPTIARVDMDHLYDPSFVRKLEFETRRVIGRALGSMSLEIVRVNARFDRSSPPHEAIEEDESKGTREILEEDLKFRSILKSDDIKSDLEELRLLMRLKQERDEIRARRARCSNCGSKIDIRSGRCPSCGHREVGT
jgi:predicted Zn-ribbon and HTH transcriptional regulator